MWFVKIDIPKMKNAARQPPVLDKLSNGRPRTSTGENPIQNLWDVVVTTTSCEFGCSSNTGSIRSTAIIL
jgi:hypothetical protein